ncbi:MAG: hypothetical protein HYX79_10010 [Chloroflexi bacterium]|nr:hypothetical protein [Chloroflexota bacterium]
MTSKSGTPWIVPDKWKVSMHNWNEEVRNGWNPPSKIIVHDVTLRDGEQTPGVVFRMEEKLRIAHALADAGVQRIEAGMAAVSTEDAETISRMAREVKNAEIADFCRTTRGDIELALKCKAGRVVIELGANEPHIKSIWGTKEKAVESLVELITFAKANGAKVTLFLMESSRADLALVKSLLIPSVTEAHVDSVALVDTRGCALPQAMAFLVRQVKQWVDVPVEVHCHNQWGLATANTLASVEAGAEVIHTCVNGLGGNAALDECVMGIEGLLGMTTGIKTPQFFEMSRLVKEYSKADWYKAFVSPTLPYTELGISTKMMWDARDKPHMGRTDVFNNEVVGNKIYTLVLGKKSGRYGIMLKAEELRLPMPSEELSYQMLDQVKNLSIKKKGLITDDEFKQIYDKVMAAKG